MKAITITETGGPQVLEYGDARDPEPGPGQLLVRTEAVGVNYIDTYFREGIYQKELPFIPGSEGAGEIVDVGEGVSPERAGERVAWCHGESGYAQLVVVDAASVVPIPPDLDADVAASALLQGITAHYLVNDTHRATSGEWVLIHAGAGGVGQLLIQLAVARGLTVITTTSTPEKAEIVRGLGAHHVLSYDDATAERVRELSGGGVATVFDGVGMDTFDASLDSLRPRGHLVLFGAASGPVPPFDPQRLNQAGSVFLTRPSMGAFTSTEEEFRQRADAIVSAVASGGLRLTVSGRYPLSEAARAHSDLQSRRTTGSIVLDPRA